MSFYEEEVESPLSGNEEGKHDEERKTALEDRFFPLTG